MEGIIDLRFCKEGDILITSQGLKMKYLEPTLKGHFYDHHVQYLDGKYKGSLGTRTHSGHVMKLKRNPETDNDIVKVVKVVVIR